MNQFREMYSKLFRFHGSKLLKKERRIAYFSMEIGLDPQVPTYSGGLGILAGDTIKSCADLNVPLVGVSLLYRKGYFYQTLDGSGLQHELPTEWNPSDFLKRLSAKITVKIEDRIVNVQAWQYRVPGNGGYYVPVLFLDTDIEGNSDYDRSLSYYLYGEDDRYRLCQEVVLGIGGVRMLQALGYHHIARYHMNEGHSALLTLELLNQRNADHQNHWDINGVKRMCVFTTHTPVPAGHDKFSYDMVRQVAGEVMPMDELRKLGGDDRLNMTLLALNLSHFVNGVAKEHGKVSREMFPGYHIDSITNGVHSATWVCGAFKKLFDKYIPGWINDPFSFRYALSIPGGEIWDAHMEAKKKLINCVNASTDAGLDENVLTIGFARRATAYKRMDLLFYDMNRLIDIARSAGKVQFIFAGKAHPRDWQGKELIKKIVGLANQMNSQVKIVYLSNYDMDLAQLVIPGVDVWLNTPQKPREASGTSGMKAAHNGVPHFSILDGWWIEGHVEGLTGWSIGSAADVEPSDYVIAESLYDKLANVIIPTFYNNRNGWIEIMRHSIAINASFFNTHRMVQQYVLSAYLY
jgi:glycogen phosphorylase